MATAIPQGTTKTPSRKASSGAPRALNLAALTLLAFGLAHAGWRALAKDFPGHKDRPSQLRGQTHWVGLGDVPLTEEGDVETATTLAIGDSRAWTGIDRHVLDGTEYSGSAVLWGSGGDLRVLLREAIKIAPQNLIVCITPHSLGPAPNRLFAEVTRQRAPVFFADEATPAEVRRWRRTEAEHLEEAGFPAALSGVLLPRLQKQFLREYNLEHRWTKRTEAGLNKAFARWRFDRVYTLQTSRWKRSWLPVNDPTIDEKPYRVKLGGDHFHSGKEAARQTVTALLKEAAEQSRVIVVRLPLSPQVRAVEDENAAPEWIASIAEEAGVPFLDFGDVDGTSDGSHLTTEAAVMTTKRIVERLRLQDEG